MPLIFETTVYHLHELSDPAKDRARTWYRDGAIDWDWFDSVYDDFEAVCRLLGVTLKTRAVPLHGGGTRDAPCIYFSGFCSQGDGACFEGRYRHARGAVAALRAHAPHDPILHAIADRLQAAQRRNFYQLVADVSHRRRYFHAGSMDISVKRDSPLSQSMTAEADNIIADALRDLADWLYNQLEREWDYVNSDACVDEVIEANAFLFTAGGRRFDDA